MMNNGENWKRIKEEESTKKSRRGQSKNREPGAIEVKNRLIISTLLSFGKDQIELLIKFY